tara:strand:+ start:63559 stop:65133 length:1575 start_codon:yes stop_codon:yes gene_type:complete
MGMDEPQQHTDSNTQPHNEHRSGGAGLLIVLLSIVCVGFVLIWQNLSLETHYKLIGATMPEQTYDDSAPAPGRFATADLVGRMFIRGRKSIMEDSPESAAMFMEQIESYEVIPEDRVRSTILIGEFEGDEPALETLEAARLDVSKMHEQAIAFDPDAEVSEDNPAPMYAVERLAPILADLDALETIYRDGREAIEKPESDRLVSRYGVLGQAAITHGMDDSDPLREPAVTGFVGIVLLMLGLILLVLFAFFGGCVLLILGIVQFSSGKLRMRYAENQPIVRPKTVFLETYSIFVVCFGIMSIGLFALSVHVRPSLGGISIFTQWLLLLIPLWALLRGVSRKDWKQSLGLHRGEGVLKEIGCGFLAYLASVPVYFLGVLVVFVLMLLSEAFKIAMGSSTAPEAMTNPVMDIIAASGPLGIALFFLLATLWAPLTEEMIFRGALFKYFRGRLHWVFAGLLTATLFAFMHNYGPMLVAPLIALGFMFSFMREWRGSIIAAMTAHFIHNATLFIFMITLIQLIKDPII